MESISTVLFSLYRGTSIHEEWLVACLSGAWQGLLGERLASACRPLEVRQDELVVEVLDAAWLPAIAGMTQDLLLRIQTASGNEIRQLSIVLRPPR
jgi:hypothetical protein